MRFLVFFFLSLLLASFATAIDSSPAEQFLSYGDHALRVGDYEAAIEQYQRGIDGLNDDDDDDESLLTILSLHTNLATAYSSSSTVGNEEQAIAQYQKAISLYIRDIDDIVDDTVHRHATSIVSEASFYLGMVYQDSHQPELSVSAYKFASELDPNHWASMANLASVEQDEFRHFDVALEYYNTAYNLLTMPGMDPTDPPEEEENLKSVLSQLQYRIGLCLNHFSGDDHDRKCTRIDDPDRAPISCKEMATHAFSMAVKFDPDNDLARHMLATVTADATMTRASNEYVKSLFDDYASNFEHSLVKDLNYTGYQRLRIGFDRAVAIDLPYSFPRVLDAGCGTGLVGEQFRNISQWLVGVDLSQRILDEAEKLRPGLYDERIAGDVMEIVVNQKEPFSLIVAADSFIYFGDLVPLFESIGKGIEKGGYLAFTLENVGVEDEQSLSETKPDWRWQLTPSGRFAHRKEYVKSVARSVGGFEVIRYETLDGFRHEQGVDVRGHLFVMKRKESNEEL